jgi:ribokinase
LTYRGASTYYKKSDYDISKIHDMDWVYATTMKGDFETLRQIFLQAKSSGARVAYNPGKKELTDSGKLMNLLPMVDVLITNREEMMKIVPGEHSIEMIKQAVKLVPIVAITDGANGAVASDGQQLVVAGIYNNLRPTVDRTGAGDAFGSGFVVRLAEGKSLRDAVHFGSANASEVCQAIGTKTNILRKSARIHDMPIEVKNL